MSTVLPVRTAVALMDRAVVLSRRHLWGLLALGGGPLALGSLSRYVPLDLSLGARYLLSLPIWIFYAFGQTVITVAAWELLHDRTPRAAECWGRVLRRAGAISVSTLLKLVVVWIGAIALLFPAIYLVGIYFAVPVLCVLEDAGPLAAFSRSRALALRGLGGVVLAAGGAFVLALAGQLGIPALLTLLHVPRLSPIRMASGTAWVMVVEPFRAVLIAILYLELRVRTEGYDLQELLAALPPAEEMAPA